MHQLIVDYFWAFNPVPFGIYFYFFVPVSHCFDDYSFVVELEVRDPDFSSFVFLKITLDIQGLFCLPINFTIFFILVLWKMSLII